MANTYDLIETKTTGSTVTSVTFSAIPQKYKDLVMWVSARTDRSSATVDNVAVQFNNDTGNNYVEGGMYNQRSTPTTFTSGGVTNKIADFCYAASGATLTSEYGACWVYIPNYSSTTQRKVTTSDNQGNAFNMFMYGYWGNPTDGISTIKLMPGSGTNFYSGCVFSLYGITKS
jgi:hypothetical protein